MKCTEHTGQWLIFFFFFNRSKHISFYLFIYLFIYLLLCWVFVSVRGFSLVVASGGHSSSRCAGLSLSRPLLLRSTGSRRAGSVVVAHGPSCSEACGIFPDQGLNPCPLHWQADSQPLRHQGSLVNLVFQVKLLTWRPLHCLLPATGSHTQCVLFRGGLASPFPKHKFHMIFNKRIFKKCVILLSLNINRALHSIYKG